MARTVRAAFIRGFDQVVRDLGGDPDGLAEQAGLSLAAVDDPDALIPAEKALRILSLSATACNCDHFGIEMARQRELDRYMGILSEIVKVAPTLGDAFEGIFEIFSIHSEVSVWQLHREKNIAYATFALLKDSPSESRQVQQYAIAIFWRVISALSHERWHPTMVSFTYSRPDIRAPYRQIFNAPVVFDGDFCGVVFHSSDLDFRLPSQDLLLNERLVKFAKSMTNATPRNFADEVRNLIRKNLELQDLGEDQISKFFPFENRTLQRKLRYCGTSYRELLCEVRIIMAKDLLTNSSMSVTRMSDRLCFSHIANFTKTFKKQTGLSPNAWRKMARSGVPHQ